SGLLARVCLTYGKLVVQDACRRSSGRALVGFSSAPRPIARSCSARIAHGGARAGGRARDRSKPLPGGGARIAARWLRFLTTQQEASKNFFYIPPCQEGCEMLIFSQPWKTTGRPERRQCIRSPCAPATLFTGARSSSSTTRTRRVQGWR